MAQKKIGEVVHWYDKISVAVVKLAGSLKTGDVVRVVKGDEEFEATVESMQLNHKAVVTAKKGQEIAVKLPQKAKQGAEVYLV